MVWVLSLQMSKKYKIKMMPMLFILVGQISWKTTDTRLIHENEKTIPFYFNHSYAVDFSELDCATSFVKLNRKLTASFEKDNIFGVQFHPEKAISMDYVS